MLFARFAAVDELREARRMLRAFTLRRAQRRVLFTRVAFFITLMLPPV